MDGREEGKCTEYDGPFSVGPVGVPVVQPQLHQARCLPQTEVEDEQDQQAEGHHGDGP